MILTKETLRDVLLESLPNGPLWPRDADSNWALLFEALAPEFARIDSLNQQLMDEMSPSTCSLMFDEWEAELGLPDPCISDPSELTFSQRQQAMVERYFSRGRQDKAFFIELADRLGYTVTIDEFSSTNPGPSGNLVVERASGETFHVVPNGDEWNYVWRVNVESTTPAPRTYPSAYGESYAEFGVEILECTLRQFAHEHRILIFAYV